MLDQRQIEDLAQRVTAAIGQTKLEALTTNQTKICELMLTKRLKKVKFQPDQINDAELVGIYEMVAQELQPIDW